jgi:hypothetical protein
LEPLTFGESHDLWAMMYHESAGHKNSDQTITSIDMYLRTVWKVNVNSPLCIFQSDRCAREYHNHYIWCYFYMMILCGLDTEYCFIYPPSGHDKWLNDQAYSNFKKKEVTDTVITPERSLQNLTSMRGKYRNNGVLNWRFHKWRELIDSMCDWKLANTLGYSAVHITRKGIRARNSFYTGEWSDYYCPLKPSVTVNEQIFAPEIVESNLPLSANKKKGNWKDNTLHKRELSS